MTGTAGAEKGVKATIPKLDPVNPTVLPPFSHPTCLASHPSSHLVKGAVVDTESALLVCSVDPTAENIADNGACNYLDPETADSVSNTLSSPSPPPLSHALRS